MDAQHDVKKAKKASYSDIKFIKGIQPHHELRTTDKDHLKMLAFANGLSCMVLDGGNRKIKLTVVIPEGNADNGSEASQSYARTPIDFTHALTEISESDYYYTLEEAGNRNVNFLVRKQVGEDFHYYAVGDMAYRYEQVINNRQERSKFTTDYYTIMWYHALYLGYVGQIPDQLNTFLLYAPNDRDQVEALKDCVRGSHKFWIGREEFNVRVRHIGVIAEVQCSAFCLSLDNNGIEYADHIFKSSTRKESVQIVYDLGGGTFDWAVLVNGIPDFTRQLGSRAIGINDATIDFKNMVDRKFAPLLRNQKGGMPMPQIHEAFMSKDKNILIGGGDYLETADLYRRATAPVINTMRSIVESIPTIGVDSIMGTGGGSALFQDEFEDMQPARFRTKGNIHYPTRNKEDRMYANAKGGSLLILSMMRKSLEAWAKLKGRK